jgi:hypothetical protein
VNTTYIGVVGGLHTWEVRDDGGSVVGVNQSETLAPAVPESITPWQLRTWLLQRKGITPDQVIALLSGIADPIARAQAMIDWDYPSEIRRDHPLIGTLGAALGLSSSDVDQAFREAAGLS